MKYVVGFLLLVAPLAQAKETPPQNLFRNAMSFSGQSGISRPFLRGFQSLVNETKCEFADKAFHMKWRTQPAGVRRDFHLEAICKVKASESQSEKDEVYSVELEGYCTPEADKTTGYFKLLGLQ